VPLRTPRFMTNT